MAARFKFKDDPFDFGYESEDEWVQKAFQKVFEVGVSIHRHTHRSVCIVSQMAILDMHAA